MGTILDTSLLYLRDPEHLIRVMSTNPSYLQSTAGGEAIQYRDWGIPLGRRFRALKLWYQLRLDGPESIRQRLRRDLDNAQWFADRIAEKPGWEVVAPVRLQTVCVRIPPLLEGDAAGSVITTSVGFVMSTCRVPLFVPIDARRWMDGEGVDRRGVDRTTTPRSVARPDGRAHPSRVAAPQARFSTRR